MSGVKAGQQIAIAAAESNGAPIPPDEIANIAMQFTALATAPVSLPATNFIQYPPGSQLPYDWPKDDDLGPNAYRVTADVIADAPPEVKPIKVPPSSVGVFKVWVSELQRPPRHRLRRSTRLRSDPGPAWLTMADAARLERGERSGGVGDRRGREDGQEEEAPMMFNETVFLGECPVIQPDGIYYGGRRVIRIGMSGVGLGDVGDLLAYRQEWEPFIAAYLTQWRQVNDLFEQNSGAKDCPPGIFAPNQIKNRSRAPYGGSVLFGPGDHAHVRSDTHPQGILTRWNAWKDKSSIDMVAGAPACFSGCKKL